MRFALTEEAHNGAMALLVIFINIVGDLLLAHGENYLSSWQLEEGEKGDSTLWLYLMPRPDSSV